MNTPIRAFLQLHRGKQVIAGQFPNTVALNQRFRQLPRARWSQTLKSWYVPDTAEYRKRFGLEEQKSAENEITKIAHTEIAAVAPINSNRSKVHPCNSHVLPAVEQLLILKGYSPRTPVVPTWLR